MSSENKEEIKLSEIQEFQYVDPLSIKDIKEIVNTDDLEKDSVWWRCKECNIFLYTEKHTSSCKYFNVYPADRTEAVEESSEEIWKVLTDPSTGKLYYLNTQTNTTQWEPPKELQSTITNTLSFRYDLAKKYCSKHPRPRVFMDMNFAGKPGGRIVIELYGENCPVAAYNFLRLCSGEDGIGVQGYNLSYVTTSIHYIKKDIGVYGGDLSNQNLNINDSIYGELFIDENIGKETSEKDGLVYMVNNGKNTNGSQFLITSTYHEDIHNNSVCVGYVLSGLVVIKKILNDQDENSNLPRIAYDFARCGICSDEGKIDSLLLSNNNNNEEENIVKIDKPCFDFLQGHCSKGDKCPFQHIITHNITQQSVIINPLNPQQTLSNPLLAAAATSNYYQSLYYSGAVSNFQNTLNKIDENKGVKWMKVIDPSTQVPYYYNKETGQTQWEVPEDYVEYDVLGGNAEGGEEGGGEDELPDLDEQMREVQRELQKQSTINENDANYKSVAGFNKKTGSFEGSGADSRFTPSDKEGRQLAYFMDLNQLQKPTQKKKRPKLPPGYKSWDDFAADYKEKKRKRRIQNILDDPYERNLKAKTE